MKYGEGEIGGMNDRNEERERKRQVRELLKCLQGNESSKSCSNTREVEDDRLEKKKSISRNRVFKREKSAELMADLYLPKNQMARRCFMC